MVQNSQLQSKFCNSLSSVPVEPLLSVPDDGMNLDIAKKENKIMLHFPALFTKLSHEILKKLSIILWLSMVKNSSYLDTVNIRKAFVYWKDVSIEAVYPQGELAHVLLTFKYLNL